MAAPSVRQLGFYWRSLTRLDRVALAIVALYVLVRLVEWQHPGFPMARFFGFLFFLSLGYFAYRLLAWARARLLWSLRNRLIVAYLFIAVVPILLLLAMVLLSARILYSQLGAYLLYDDLQSHIARISHVAQAAAEMEFLGSPALPRSGAVPEATVAQLFSWAQDLPGLRVEMGAGDELLRRYTSGSEQFAGILQSADKLALVGVAARRGPTGRVAVMATAPFSSELLDKLASFLGPIQMVATRPGSDSGVPEAVGRYSTRRRTLPPRAHLLDFAIDGISRMEAFPAVPSAAGASPQPVFAFFTVRPSVLNRRLFSSLGADIYLQVLIVIGVIFLLLEAGALTTGVILTRTITHAVADLYRATEHVQSGDLTYRVRIQQNDQLGALGESFNSMTSSISSLIEEQRQRQRLENELSIAREVQEQLFPRSLPKLPGIELEARCCAARMVSGDYYDFLHLGPSKLGIALADISGKGISAALLMASLQAALRSQAVLDGAALSNTAEMVTRLNLHLFRNTSADRYATFFYAVYDAASRTLHYTNAGHLPPLFVVGEQVRRLDIGGMVVGLFDDCTYEQGSLRVEPGGLLVAYSDGLVEPENVYGEEFGTRRLIDLVLRHRTATPEVLASLMISTVEEWHGSPERSDDMTVIVARIG